QPQKPPGNKFQQRGTSIIEAARCSSPISVFEKYLSSIFAINGDYSESAPAIAIATSPSAVTHRRRLRQQFRCPHRRRKFKCNYHRRRLRQQFRCPTHRRQFKCN
ncbi:PREDICTED: uncharacterized protein LOC108369584, partial [Rhagoletis zephyria]|uniref:uncharacterized protein LOC108369584 n=1 Tax=Rhagoletis zephyria TaxID=28612 RepID=UPI0008112187